MPVLCKVLRIQRLRYFFALKEWYKWDDMRERRELKFTLNSSSIKHVVCILTAWWLYVFIVKPILQIKKTEAQKQWELFREWGATGILNRGKKNPCTCTEMWRGLIDPSMSYMLAIIYTSICPPNSPILHVLTNSIQPSIHLSILPPSTHSC